MTGPELRALRTAKRWTQAELAQQAGVTQNNVSDYERGAKNITRRTAILFSLLLTPPPTHGIQPASEV